MFSTKILANRIFQRKFVAVSNRFLTAAVKENVAEKKIFRATENDPTKHKELESGLFYTISQDVANELFAFGGLEKEQQLMMKTFRETSFMIRKPAIDIIDSLNKTDFDKAHKKYVLHGRIGTGKSFTMNHILHYGHSNKFIILYCGKPTSWTRFPQESSVSPNNPKRIDEPLDSAIWLQQFKAQNLQLLEKLNLKSRNQYTWSAREITNEGDTLLSIVDHGINRVKHASDCVAVILKELKLAANSNECRLMVAIEKVNSFYEPSEIQFPDRIYASIDEITLTRAFKKFITDKDWKNGVLIATVDKKLVVPYRILPIHGPKVTNPNDKRYNHWGPFSVKNVSDLPEDLLREEGMKDFGQFESIQVEKYTDKELISCLEYYEDRHWIQRDCAKSAEGREEIRFLSGNNPGQVYELCSNF